MVKKPPPAWSSGGDVTSPPSPCRPAGAASCPPASPCPTPCLSPLRPNRSCWTLCTPHATSPSLSAVTGGGRDLAHRWSKSGTRETGIATLLALCCRAPNTGAHAQKPSLCFIPCLDHSWQATERWPLRLCASLVVLWGKFVLGKDPRAR